MTLGHIPPIETYAYGLSAAQLRMAALIGRLFERAGYGQSMQAAAITNAYAESRLDPRSWGDRSEKYPLGCSGGLFQLNVCGGAGMGMTRIQVENPFLNIARIIRELNGHFGRPVRFAYQAGERDVQSLTELFCRHVLRPMDSRRKGQARAEMACNLFPGLALPVVGEESYGAAWRGFLRESDWSEEQRLKSLDPMLRRLVVTLMGSLRLLGWRPVIVSAWRSLDTQGDLWRNGQTEIPFSFHNVVDDDWAPAALAVDLMDERYQYGEQITENGTVADIAPGGMLHKARDFFMDLVSEGHKLGLSPHQSAPGRFMDLRRLGFFSYDPSHLQLLPGWKLSDHQARMERMLLEVGLDIPWDNGSASRAGKVLEIPSGCFELSAPGLSASAAVPVRGGDGAAVAAALAVVGAAAVLINRS